MNEGKLEMVRKLLMPQIYMLFELSFTGRSKGGQHMTLKGRTPKCRNLGGLKERREEEGEIERGGEGRNTHFK